MAYRKIKCPVSTCKVNREGKCQFYGNNKTVTCQSRYLYLSAQKDLLKRIEDTSNNIENIKKIIQENEKE